MQSTSAPTSATQPVLTGASQPADEPIALDPAFVALRTIATSPRLTGNWLGARKQLEDAGISVIPVLITGYVQNLAGGVNTHNAIDFPGFAQYNTEFDFEKMKLIPGGSFFIRPAQSWGDGIRPDVGELFQPDYLWGNLGDHEIYVDKWWYRQRLLNNHIELRLGKIVNAVDLFDVTAYASSPYNQFNNATISANPTIPTSKGIGAFIKAWLTDWLYLQAAAIDPDQLLTRTGFDTAFHGPDHFRGYWEAGLTPQWQGPRGRLPGNYRVGGWYDPQTKRIFHKTYEGNLPQRYRAHDWGWYLTSDQLLWKENETPGDKQGLGLFFRLGVADGDVNKINHYWAVGGQYEGLITGRDRDLTGFAVAQSRSSGPYRRIVDHDAAAETIYEMYYNAEILPWLTITPDVQVIQNPGAVSTAHDALVAGVRMKVTF